MPPKNGAQLAKDKAEEAAIKASALAPAPAAPKKSLSEILACCMPRGSLFAAKLAKPHPLDLEIQQRFLTLDMQGRCMAEYVWIGGNNELRCKTRSLDKETTNPDELPVWNFDGSSTEQAPGTDSEVLLVPRAVYKDPFRAGPSGTSTNILVLCDCYKPDPNAPKGVGKPIPTNTRVKCNEIMEKIKDHEPWFGIEQEYTLFEPDGVTPYGWPKGGYPDRPQGPYYCSIGAENAFGRPIVETHYRACMYAGIQISGINGEVMPGQWEYQVGPCTGIASGDQLIMSRYLLIRVCEQVRPSAPSPHPAQTSTPAHIRFSSPLSSVLEPEPELLTRSWFACLRAVRRARLVRPEADPGRLERRGLPHERLDEGDAREGRLRRHHQGDGSPRRAGQAGGAHPGIRHLRRRGQQAPPHRRARDGADHQVLVRRRQPWLLGPHPAHDREGEVRLL